MFLVLCAWFADTGIVWAQGLIEKGALDGIAAHVTSAWYDLQVVIEAGGWKWLLGVAIAFVFFWRLVKR